MTFAAPPPDAHALLGSFRCQRVQHVPIFENNIGPETMSRILERPHSSTLFFSSPEIKAEVAERIGLSSLIGGVILQTGRKTMRDGSGQDVYVDGMVKCRADLARFRAPSLEAIHEQIAREIEVGHRHDLAVGIVVYSPLTIAQLGIGLGDFMVKLHDDRDLIQAMFDHALDFYLPVVEEACKRAADFLFVGEMICYGSGPMFHPDLTREFLHESLAPFMRLARSYDVSVVLHSDGDNSEFIEDFIELGVNAHVDLCGVLTRGTAAQVSQDVRDHLRRLGDGPGYVLGSSHELSDDIPVENLRAFLETYYANRSMVRA